MSQSIYSTVSLSPAERRRIEQERQRRLEEERRRREEERKKREEEKRQAEIAAEKQRLEQEREIIGDIESRKRSLFQGKIEQLRKIAASRGLQEGRAFADLDEIQQKMNTATGEALQELSQQLQLLEQKLRTQNPAFKTHIHDSDKKKMTREESQLRLDLALRQCEQLKSKYGKVAFEDLQETQSSLLELKADKSENYSYLSSILKGIEDRLRQQRHEIETLAERKEKELESSSAIITALISKSEVVSRSSQDDGQKRKARTLLALLEHANSLDDPQEISKELKNIEPEVNSLWQQNELQQQKRGEQRYIIQTVSEALVELGYEVAAPAYTEPELHTSPRYIHYEIPGGQEVQIGFSQTGELVAEVIHYVSDDDPDPDDAAEEMQQQTEQWCGDYRRLAESLKSRGLEIDTKYLHDFDAAKARRVKDDEKAARYRSRRPWVSRRMQHTKQRRQ